MTPNTSHPNTPPAQSAQDFRNTSPEPLNYSSLGNLSSLWPSGQLRLVSFAPEAMTESFETQLHNIFTLQVADLPIEEVAIFRAGDNAMAIWAVADRLKEDDADTFYNRMADIQSMFSVINIDLRLIERRGRSRDQLDVPLPLLRPGHRQPNAQGTTAL